MWAHSVDIYHPSLGTYQALTPRERQDTGSWSLRLVVWVREGGGGPGKEPRWVIAPRGESRQEGVGGPAWEARLLGVVQGPWQTPFGPW